MLSCVLRDVSGKAIKAPPLLELSVNIDEGVPADSLYAVFPYRDLGELIEITLYDDGKMLFDGVVDEQEHEESGKGGFLKISARSRAALLLDNEAMPCAYDHPSMRFIYERYVAPFGITMREHDDAVYFGEQTILKGFSCWRVLKKFCAACYSALPRVSSVGVLYPKGMVGDGTVIFGRENVRYTSLSVIKKRCEELSAVYVKASNAGSYIVPVENRDAIRRGISRVRYLNAALNESPMRCADMMLRNSEAKAFTVRLRCPSCLIGCEGNRALIRDSALEEDKDLYISAVRYRMTADGAYTDVTLKRRKGDVDQ